VRTIGAVVAIILVGLVAAVAVIASRPQPSGFRTWIAEIRDGDDDWGWELLGAEARDAYGGDRGAYLADMRAADWTALVLGPPADVWSDDGFVRVVSELGSDPTSVPRFLFDRRIVHGECDEGQPFGLGAYEDRRLFEDGVFSGGGLTGGQARCNRAFTSVHE
jgi:hypothetical protein